MEHRDRCNNGLELFHHGDGKAFLAGDTLVSTPKSQRCGCICDELICDNVRCRAADGMQGPILVPRSSGFKRRPRPVPLETRPVKSRHETAGSSALRADVRAPISSIHCKPRGLLGGAPRSGNRLCTLGES